MEWNIATCISRLLYQAFTCVFEHFHTRATTIWTFITGLCYKEIENCIANMEKCLSILWFIIISLWQMETARCTCAPTIIPHSSTSSVLACTFVWIQRKFMMLNSRLSSLIQQNLRDGPAHLSRSFEAGNSFLRKRMTFHAILVKII